jgi:zinc protease
MSSFMSSVTTRSRRWAIAALGLLGPLWGVGAARAWAPSCEPAERYTLSNGVEVVLVPTTSLPTVAVVSSVHAGSRNDPPGYEGLAHYVEHLTFRSQPPFASAFDLYQEIGANGLNATTSPDATEYFALVPASQLERALWIEARRLGLGLAALDDALAAEERKVLLREHEWRFGWEPAFAVTRATYEALFPKGHPYHAFFATEKSIAQLTLNDARSFFAQWYRPERTRLVLVGDFAAASAKALIERYFGALEAGAAVAGAASADCAWGKQTLAPSRSRIVLRSLSKNERLELYWPVHAEEEAESVRGVFDLLHGELSAALRQTGLAHQVSAELVNQELNSFWAIGIDVAPGQPFDKIEPLVKQVVVNLRGEFAGEKDLAAQRQALELSDLASQTQLLDRARYLARRECQAAACLDAAKLLTPTAVNQLDRFAPEQALVVERRYSAGASPDGDLEVLP